MSHLPKFFCFADAFQSFTLLCPSMRMPSCSLLCSALFSALLSALLCSALCVALLCSLRCSALCVALLSLRTHTPQPPSPRAHHHTTPWPHKPRIYSELQYDCRQRQQIYVLRIMLDSFSLKTHRFHPELGFQYLYLLPLPFAAFRREEDRMCSCPLTRPSIPRHEALGKAR